MPRSATLATARRSKQPSAKRSARPSPKKPKRTAPKKAKPTAPTRVVRASPKRGVRASSNKTRQSSVAAMQARIDALEAELREERDQRTATAQQLAQSFAYQTATSDVLKVISRSIFNLETVFETVVRNAIHLCHADNAGIYINDSGEYRRAVGVDVKSREYDRIEASVRIAPGTGTVVGRAALQKSPVHIEDAWTDPLYEPKHDARIGGVHTMLGVPLCEMAHP